MQLFEYAVYYPGRDATATDAGCEPMLLEGPSPMVARSRREVERHAIRGLGDEWNDYLDDVVVVVRRFDMTCVRSPLPVPEIPALRGMADVD